VLRQRPLGSGGCRRGSPHAREDGEERFGLTLDDSPAVCLDRSLEQTPVIRYDVAIGLT